MAALLLLAGLVVLGAPSTALAHGGPAHSGVHHPHDARQDAVPAVHEAVRQADQDVWAAAPAAADAVGAAPTDCGGRGGGNGHFDCCHGAACPLMHAGVAPAGLVLAPPLEGPALLAPSGVLFDGVGTLPDPEPPRRRV